MVGVVQLVPAGSSVCETPFVGWQASAVHGLPSSVATGAPGAHAPDWQVSVSVQTLPSLHAVPFAFSGFEQTPVAGLHVPALWHWSLAMQMTGLPAAQVPDWQVSICVQPFPSLHGVPFGFAGFEQTPVAGLQVPALWHWLLAMHTTGFAPVQVPDWQVSGCVQALLSLHAVPFGFAGFEQPVDGLHVPAL
jgi:hypothetical protein